MLEKIERMGSKVDIQNFLIDAREVYGEVRDGPVIENDMDSPMVSDVEEGLEDFDALFDGFGG